MELNYLTKLVYYVFISTALDTRGQPSRHSPNNGKSYRSRLRRKWAGPVPVLRPNRLWVWWNIRCGWVIGLRIHEAGSRSWNKVHPLPVRGRLRRRRKRVCSGSCDGRHTRDWRQWQRTVHCDKRPRHHFRWAFNLDQFFPSYISWFIIMHNE